MSAQGHLLEGIRVLDVGTYIFGPAAATVMGDFGADVIKIEPPTGDPYRRLYQLPPMPACEEDYCWLLDGRNKRSIAIDLKSDEGRAIALKLVRGADVFLTNYHPSVLGALKLTYEELKPLNEKLIYAHATGYGESGPEVEKPGFDLTAYWARSGMMDLVRNADSEPALSLAGMGDHPSSLALFGGIMLALFARSMTGKGTKVSTSLMANGAWANSCLLQGALCGSELYRPRRRAEAENALVNHYRTRDERRFILCCINTARDWPLLCRTIGREELLSDPRFAQDAARKQNMNELIAILEEVFAQKDLDDWMTIFQREGVTFSPVSELREVVDDEQMKSIGVFAELEHPSLGRVPVVSSPITLADHEKVSPRLAPAIGEHSEEILASLGLDSAAIEKLFASGAVLRPQAAEA